MVKGIDSNWPERREALQGQDRGARGNILLCVNIKKSYSPFPFHQLYNDSTKISQY